jgi:acetyl esterase/lipase
MSRADAPIRSRRSFAVAVCGLAFAAGSAAAGDPEPTHADVSFGPHAHQLLDVYLPPKGDGPYPVVVWFGGIWKPAKHPAPLGYFGNAKCAVIAVQTRTLTDAVADKAAVPISYVAEDACRAVQFVRLNAARWNLNPDRIAVGGSSQGALPALYVACAGERADPKSTDPVERVSTRVTCAAAHRSQPSIDPKRMREWVPGVEWGAPALGCGFADSLKRHGELLPTIAKWSPDHLLHKGVPPIYFENNWGLTQPDTVTEADYKVHSPAWALGFQKLAGKAGVACYVKYPDHPTEKYKDIWEFLAKELTAPK